MSMHWIDKNQIRTGKNLSDAVSSVRDTTICIATKEIYDHVDKEVMMQDLQMSDVIHSGLVFEGKDAFSGIQSLTVNWNFLLPASTTSSTSWKGTTDFVVFDSGIISLIGGIDSGYDSANAALMDFIYRLLMNGARVTCNPMYSLPDCEFQKTITAQDEIRFIQKHFPGNALFFYKVIRAKLFARAQPIITPLNAVPDASHFKLITTRRHTVTNYTAIIPTINRYDYLAQAIQSLLDCTFPPAEIIVVDQTPMEKRIHGYYDDFTTMGLVKIVFLDEAGQAISRNTGIDMASCEWIYLFDDDSVCWKDCLEEHRFLVEHSASDVSTGLSLAPWKDRSYIKGNITYYRIADVLDTGNCFIRKSVLQAVGKIDNAFNKGPGADDDLGKRLYMAGYQIVLNPKAIRTHYKAKTGGLREHGAWWRNTSKLLEAYPPPTQLYMIRKYYAREKWFAQILLFYFLGRKKTTFLRFLLTLFLAPLKYSKSLRKVKVLESQS